MSRSMLKSKANKSSIRWEDTESYKKQRNLVLNLYINTKILFLETCISDNRNNNIGRFFLKPITPMLY